MAEGSSRGVHTPVALPYLIAEGLLPHDPGRDSYRVETYVYHDADHAVRETLVVTKTCVVWSQDEVIRKVYRFDREGEEVIQAVITRFPSTFAQRNEESAQHGAAVDRGYGSSRPQGASTTPSTPNELARAIVVLLKTKAHVYFLNGSDHIIDLPFEVSKALAAPRGLLLQRKVGLLSNLPPTPKLPAAPPNSFLSSQRGPSSSYLHSPTLVKSLAPSQPLKRSPLGGNTGLDALYQSIFGTLDSDVDGEVAALYSLTTPLSDLGVVSYSHRYHRPRISSKAPSGLNVEFEALDTAEQPVYMSFGDELRKGGQSDHGQLTLLVTVNTETGVLTVWHTWYINEQSLSSLLKQRAAQKAAKAKRRSSFMSTHVATAATTPAVRTREGARESFAAGGPRLQAEANGAVSSRKPTRQEEEVEMAHQMDPDFQPAASQQTFRESRRISSLNADARGVQYGNTSFATTAGRRNTSFGGPGERRSLGHRKSRGSTPGSIFSRGLRSDDEMMELDSSFDIESDENVDAVVRHIRATHEAAAGDGIFGGIDENFKRELMVHKVHSMNISLVESGDLERVQVLTLRDPLPSRTADGQRIGVYIHDGVSNNLTCLHIDVKHPLLWPKTQDTARVAVPALANVTKLGKCTGIVKLRDGTVEALLSSEGLFISPGIQSPCPIRTTALYGAHSGSNVSSHATRGDSETGGKRTLAGLTPKWLEEVVSAGNNQHVEVGPDDLHYRLHLKMAPSNDGVARLLRVCQLILPPLQAQLVSGIWMLATASLLHQSQFLASTTVDTEMLAFAVVVFVLTGHLGEKKTRAGFNVARASSGKSTTSHVPAQIIRHRRLARLSGSGAWRSMSETRFNSTTSTGANPTRQAAAPTQDQCLPLAAQLADGMLRDIPWLSSAGPPKISATAAGSLMLALHIFREEQKLCVLPHNGSTLGFLAAFIAQLGDLLGLRAWSFDQGTYFGMEGALEDRWAFLKFGSTTTPQLPVMDEPVSVFMWFEHTMTQHTCERYPTLADIVSMSQVMIVDQEFTATATELTPRILALSDMVTATSGFSASPAVSVELMAKHGIWSTVLETLPQAIAAPFKEAIARCEREPPTAWPPHLLELISRDEVDLDKPKESIVITRRSGNGNGISRDIQAICSVLDPQPQSAKTKEASRHAVSQLIFNEDRRLVEATSLMHYNSPQVAECPKQPDWSEAYHLDQQRRVLQWITTRMIALPCGDGMLHFNSQTPLLTEKYHLSGFSSACVIQPMGHTLTVDRSGLTEEKVNWAYFHAGVSAGLRISKNARGIDTSWIAFNKPNDLTNRHAGLLLALGLRGHLRHLAKWLSFKYLTPKHTVTSVGLLLGLSASYMGTMDGLITRMLSVHVTRMLPLGAAELNVSPITQTAGLMGIGLLYYNTQHRRMSEIMLSEVEHMELEDPDSGPDPLRDESYRLAAGFALGFINLGKGDDLHGLSGMHLPERLLAIAVGSRPVSAVHVFDRATAGAIMGIALVYMKSGERSIARKIDIPDTEAQFDHVRPDMLMLRAMAKHIILWDGIVAGKTNNGEPYFVQTNLPSCYQGRFSSAVDGKLSLKSSDVPFFNIVSGLVLALSLRYAGTGNELARDEILTVLDYFYKAKGSGDASFYYDAKLTRATVRRCIDVVALAAATVMAGTGDLKTFRYLRRLHGRTDAETPYGSHLAAHLAIGVLFLGGGTYTFSTSNLAVASLLCAFYPLFPTDVHDNHVHLQAFRHFWVFAAEARCLIIEDIDTQRPIPMPVEVSMSDGTIRKMASPCLLPELDSIAAVSTSDPSYWRVTLDFEKNPKHLAHFKDTQRISVRRCPPSEAYNTTFTATMAALNDVQLITQPTNKDWQTVFDLPSFRDIDKAETELILPPNAQSSVNTDEQGTIVDDRLALAGAVNGEDREALWNMRLLFAWAEKASEDGDGKFRWLGEEMIDSLKARIEERMQRSGGAE